MASYTPSEPSARQWKERLSLLWLQRLSLPWVKRITLGLLLCTLLGFVLLWRPAYLQIKSLRKEKTYWQQIQGIDLANKQRDALIAAIPTMDELPDVIEQCRSEFVKAGVEAAAFNVERFGERRKTGNGADLDYSLVRVHLLGTWEGIVASLEKLEDNQSGKIHPQEVALDSEGGEVLLQIYFCTGE